MVYFKPLFTWTKTGKRGRKKIPFIDISKCWHFDPKTWLHFSPTVSDIFALLDPSPSGLIQHTSKTVDEFETNAIFKATYAHFYVI